MEARIWLGGALIVTAAVWSAFARAPAPDDDRRTLSPQDLP
jgi:hypothetical protein